MSNKLLTTNTEYKTDRLSVLQAELLTISPRRDFLHEICGCGIFAEITRTSDGYFLGRAHGDCGFNAFLGMPSQNALDRTVQFLKQLTTESRSLASALLDHFGMLDVTFTIESEG